MIDIQKYFDKNCFELTRENIYSLNDQDNGPINNVISHLEDYCYGIRIFDDKKFIEYQLFYIDHKIQLGGVEIYLSMELNADTRNDLTIAYCKLLNDRYPHADIIDSFNTFQSQLRSGFEKIGYFTLGNEISKFEGKDAIGVFPQSKGIVIFPTLDKKGFYRWFFGESEKEVKTNESKIKKIYLILDSSTNLIKIGQSYYPKTREKTLHGESPHWDLITTWVAPVSVETELHTKFKHKRKRGEWFDLDLSDLKELKGFMSKYEKSL